jgi:hypothetical protein
LKERNYALRMKKRVAGHMQSNEEKRPIEYETRALI